MRLDQLRPGLWRWTASHPEWRPAAEPESPADWPERVGCVAVRLPDGFAFIDPLLPQEGPEAFWADVDALVAGTKRVWVLTTIQFHRRNRDHFAARYDASTTRAKAQLPQGIEPIPIRGAGETMFWLSEHRALVTGDRIMGDGRGGLRMCPESWLRYLPSGIDLKSLRVALAPLLELPVEAVLVSHGEPVLEGAHAALRHAVMGR
jgi:hypothetical protein